MTEYLSTKHPSVVSFYTAKLNKLENQIFKKLLNILYFKIEQIRESLTTLEDLELLGVKNIDIVSS